MANEPAKQPTTTQLRPSEKLPDFLYRRAQEVPPDLAWQIAATQLDRVLSSETIEQMWDSDNFESVGGRDIEDVEQQINQVRYSKSDKYDSGIPLPDGTKAFVFLTSQRLDTGEEFVWNTGSPLIIGKVRWLEAAGKLGTEEARCVVKGREAPNGRVITLRPIPRRATAGQTET